MTLATYQAAWSNALSSHEFREQATGKALAKAVWPFDPFSFVLDFAHSSACVEESQWNGVIMNYEAIKALAKASHTPVKKLIALTPQNDPFYTGTERDKTLGAWFRDLWQQFGYTTGVHIRRMHYAIVNQSLDTQRGHIFLQEGEEIHE